MSRDEKDQEPAVSKVAPNVNGVPPGPQSAPPIQPNNAGAGGAPPPGGPGEPPPPDHPSATTRTKIWFVIVLTTATVLLLIVGAWTLWKLQEGLTKEARVAWKQPTGVTLKPGPPTFWYDSEENALVHRGPINDEIKKQLIALIDTTAEPPNPDPSSIKKEAENPKKATKPDAAKPPPQTQSVSGEQSAADKAARQAAIQSFGLAIDKLAYLSNSELKYSSMYLFLLAGLGGAIGVQIRSMSNFIGVAVFKNELNVARYWPWFALRPFLGFVLGVVLVVMVKSRLFVPSDTATQGDITQGDMWWLGITVLVGFGVYEFHERLRSLARTMFGETSGERPKDKV